MLLTELQTQHIPYFYRQFDAMLGAKHWLGRVRQCEDALRGNRFLEYLRDENSIAYGLRNIHELVAKYPREVPPHLLDDEALYPAASFAAQVVSLHDNFSADEKRKLVRRIYGGFKKPDDLRGLRLEISASTHFVTRGFQVEWAETIGAGRFDLLVTRDDGFALEVECKSISTNKGCRVHEQEVCEFLGILHPELKSVIGTVERGLAVVITVPDRLPSSYTERRELARNLKRHVLAGKSGATADGTSVRLIDYDFAALGPEPYRRSPHDLRGALDQVTGTQNRAAVILGTKRGGQAAIVIQSAKDDTFMHTTFATLRRAANEQLTGARAGMLWVSFENISAHELTKLSEDDSTPGRTPSALVVEVSEFLRSSSRPHLVGVGFTSGTELTRPGGGGSSPVSMSGAAYWFARRESPRWDDSFSGLFRWS